MDAGVAAGAECNQPGGILAAGLAVVDVGPGVETEPQAAQHRRSRWRMAVRRPP